MGIWYKDNRMDCFGITDEQVKKNVNCVAAIMLKDNLIDLKNGYSALKVKNYGEAFNLVENEHFRDQPVIAGSVRTGFLVKKDIVATAAQCVIGNKIKDLRIVFGYKMLDSDTPVIQVSNENIYNCIKIISLVYNPKGNNSSWALVQLDRKVQGQEVATLSNKDISCDQPVYVIGHPFSLPLKYVPGARVRNLKEALFAADLDIYMGNGGSPVFNADTHDVVGIVTHGDTRDFRWTGKGWASIIYPHRDISSSGPQCTKVSEFIDYINKDNTDIDFVDEVEYRQIFISYSHSDKKFVNRLTTDIENFGIEVWIDEKKIEVGEPISEKVEEGISRSDYFCLVISRNSVNSKWVEREYRTALNAQLSSGTTPKILPLLIHDVEPPLLLKDIKYADFSKRYNSGLTRLLNAIKKH